MENDIKLEQALEIFGKQEKVWLDDEPELKEHLVKFYRILFDNEIETLRKQLALCKKQRNLSIYAAPGDHIPRVVKYDAELASLEGTGKHDPALEVVEIARAQVERWFREPPVPEGGDFLAGMFKLKKAIARFDEATGVEK